MSMHATLKLADTADWGTSAFDRRERTRHTLSGHATAVQSRQSPSDVGYNRICSLQLMNISANGLGAMVPEPIELQTTLAIFFPPHGPERGIDLHGRVVRCIRRDEGHEIGVVFNSLSAA